MGNGRPVGGRQAAAVAATSLSIESKGIRHDVVRHLTSAGPRA